METKDICVEYSIGFVCQILTFTFMSVVNGTDIIQHNDADFFIGNVPK